MITFFRNSLCALTIAAALITATSATFAADVSKEQEQANLKTVLAFYDAGLNKKDLDAALPYLGDRYVQHNPSAEDGVAGFRKFIGFLKSKFPDARSEIKRSFVDGNHVILHVYAKRDASDRGRAVIDIFRLENGKIVEHWDVIQPVPETAVNTNTMF